MRLPSPGARHSIYDSGLWLGVMEMTMKATLLSDTRFAMRMVILILVTHAVSYLTHEYAHTTMAWMLGYIANPFALDYGGLTPANLILLSDVGDNVPYDAVFASGHGAAAAAIALAGPFIGNALLYVCLYAACRRRASGRMAAATFWLLLMCAGNVWSYVPIRALATHADIALAARGLQIGRLALFPLLMIPSMLLVGHFFAKACPLFICNIAQGNQARALLMIAMTTTWFFVFFGGLGMSGSYGTAAQVFSIVSEIVLLPIALAFLWHRYVAHVDA